MAAKKKSVTKKAVKKPSASDTALQDILANWNKMSNALKDLTEEQCYALIRLEQEGKNRVHMLNRIHARYTKLRSERERVDIVKGNPLPPAA